MMILRKFRQMINIIIAMLITGLLSSQSLTHAMEVSHTSSSNITRQSLFPSIKKTYPNFYVGKIKDRDLWLVMECIDKDNIKLWKHYAAIQSNPRAVDWGSQFMSSFTGDGSDHFKEVLNKVSYEENEIWIAYVTGNKNPKPIDHGASSSISSYSAGDFMNLGNAFARDIYMYVTITSSPEELITSHMGVSASIEGLTQKVRGISIDLHSFAAKVMLMRNPKRKFMITAPALKMEEMIINELPANSVFAGTKEMKQIYETRKQINLPTFKENYISELGEIKIKLLNGFLAAGWPHIKWPYKFVEIDNLLLWNAHELTEDLQNGLLTKENFEGKAKKLIESKYKEIENSASQLWDKWREPYSFPGWTTISNKEKIADIGDLFKMHPPLLSVDGHHGKYIENSFSVFEKDDPTKLFLTATKDNPKYRWMFTSPFQPSSKTHYIVVDLEMLAKAKPLDSLD